MKLKGTDVLFKVAFITNSFFFNLATLHLLLQSNFLQGSLAHLGGSVDLLNQEAAGEAIPAVCRPLPGLGCVNQGEWLVRGGCAMLLICHRWWVDVV